VILLHSARGGYAEAYCLIGAVTAVVGFQGWIQFFGWRVAKRSSTSKGEIQIELRRDTTALFPGGVQNRQGGQE
jgi:hypothetical protein